MEKLQYLSIILELMICIIAFLSVLKGKHYMLGLSFTFLVYVFYDFSRLYSFGILDNVLQVFFFLATVSAFWSIWNIYKNN